jgi:hypothetical protein
VTGLRVRQEWETKPGAAQPLATPPQELHRQCPFDGAAPEPSLVQLSGWSECAAQHPEGNPKANDMLINNGKLQNAVVYVKDGLGDRVFAVSATPVALDQRGCLFTPRILGAQTDQPLLMLNSDPLAHSARVV